MKKIFFKMLVVKIKLITFVSRLVLEAERVASIEQIFLEPVTNLKRAIIYTQVSPALAIA